MASLRFETIDFTGLFRTEVKPYFFFFFLYISSFWFFFFFSFFFFFGSRFRLLYEGLVTNVKIYHFNSIKDKIKQFIPVLQAKRPKYN